MIPGRIKKREAPKSKPINPSKQVFTTSDVAAICRVAVRTVVPWFDAGIEENLTGIPSKKPAIQGAWRIPGSQDRRCTREQLIVFLKKYCGQDSQVLNRQDTWKELILASKEHNKDMRAKAAARREAPKAVAKMPKTPNPDQVLVFVASKNRPNRGVINQVARLLNDKGYPANSFRTTTDALVVDSKIAQTLEVRAIAVVVLAGETLPKTFIPTFLPKLVAKTGRHPNWLRILLQPKTVDRLLLLSEPTSRQHRRPPDSQPRASIRLLEMRPTATVFELPAPIL